MRTRRAASSRSLPDTTIHGRLHPYLSQNIRAGDFDDLDLVFRFSGDCLNHGALAGSRGTVEESSRGRLQIVHPIHLRVQQGTEDRFLHARDRGVDAEEGVEPSVQRFHRMEFTRRGGKDRI